jgi:hypothetical protein
VLQKVRTSVSCLQRATLRLLLPCSYHIPRSTGKHGLKVALFYGTWTQTLSTPYARHTCLRNSNIIINFRLSQ